MLSFLKGVFMYFTRKFGAGLDKTSRDPRDKIFAEFKCGLCGQTSEIDISSTFATFDFNRERKCPKCGQINSEDKAINLQAQISKLTVDKSRIEIEIEKLTEELQEVLN